MSLSQEDDASFETEYSCSNCGNRWSESHSAGTEVKDDWQGVYVNHCDRTLGDPECPKCGRVECGVCGLRKHVTVEDRSPL